MIVSLNEIAHVCEKVRATGKKIVFTNGCFDILHIGHVTYLDKAKAMGDILIVGLNTDNSVRKLKGESRPINSENDRAIIVNSLKSVDYVILFQEDTPLELIKLIRPDILAKGGDYSVETIVGAEFVIQNMGEVVVIPLVEGKSTTSIIQKANMMDCK